MLAKLKAKTPELAGEPELNDEELADADLETADQKTFEKIRVRQEEKKRRPAVGMLVMPLGRSSRRKEGGGKG